MTTLTLSNRYFTITSGSSIQTITCALLELISNSLDAYDKMSSGAPAFVWVKASRGEEAAPNSLVTVTDNACGMSFAEMEKKLLVVGDYTAESLSRGMFGRGAKDCAALGDLTFTSVVDKKISRLTISSVRTGCQVEVLDRDRPASEEELSLLGIPSHGTEVALSIPSYALPPTEKLYDLLRYNAYLRLINQDDRVKLILSDESGYMNRVLYVDPPGVEAVAAEYDVPGYPGAKVKFRICVADEEIAFNPVDPPVVNCRQWGILTCSRYKSVYDNGFLHYTSGAKVVDYLWDPNARYIYGVLECPYLDQMILEACSGKTSELNPYLIYDPSRRNGLDPSHPFTAAMYSYAYQYLSVVIAKVQDRADNSLLADSSSLNDLMKGLGQFVSSLVPPPSTVYRFRTPEDNENLTQAALNSRNVHINSDFMGMPYEDILALAKGMALPITSAPGDGTSVKFLFSTDPKMKTQYQVIHGAGPITVKINANDPSLSPYLSTEGGAVTLINAGKALTTVGTIVNEVTANLQVRQRIIEKTTLIDMNSLNTYFGQYQKDKSTNAPKIFSLVQTMISAAKSGTQDPLA